MHKAYTRLAITKSLQATFAEIPGVLETGTIRKIDRRYPFNDACQVSPLSK